MSRTSARGEYCGYGTAAPDAEMAKVETVPRRAAAKEGLTKTIVSVLERKAESWKGVCKECVDNKSWPATRRGD